MMETTEKSTEKFQGLLEDEEEKSPNKPKKLLKLLKAEFDPQAAELISGLPSNRMFHEENKVSIKNLPQAPKSKEQNEELEHELDETTDKIENPKSLDQGSTLLLFLLAAFLLCACLLASTLAFVSPFRRTKIIEINERIEPFLSQI